MSSHRFPYEEPSPPPRLQTDGPIGTIRAHDQAAIDHFLIFAEQERRRLEAKVIEAEMRCREAEAQLADATMENQRVAEELYAMWLDLKAQRDHNERIVSQRLVEARAEAEELAHWTDQRPTEAIWRPRHPEPPIGRTWANLTGDHREDEYEQRSARPAPEEQDDPAYDVAAAAFFDDTDDLPPWETLDTPTPHVHEELLARHPRRQPRVAPRPPEPGVQGRRSPRPPDDAKMTASVEQEFWQVDQSAASLRIDQLESTMMSLLPMFGLVIVLVLLLVWVG
jgi:hypothetical protein